ncbi:MAG: cytochrome C [Bacteroidales bacterium]|jgi:nitrate/TMAO reductase-like tetraheme cytochrome c subunit|nr:cytochrome C [Bacteroidales bacterium]
MHKATVKIIVLFILSLFHGVRLEAQLSPGDLSDPHAHLEGISNCTQCHELGNKVSDARCLACHTEIKTRISAGKGYHSSAAVKGKACFTCHSEHNGKSFNLIRLDISSFEHSATGYTLSGSHAVQECSSCHKRSNIADPKIKSKKRTYLGLGTACLTCHTDYHQQTLSSACLDCHGYDKFVPATKFDHSTAKFRLIGSHKNVECIKCHKKVTVSGKVFQEFRGVLFSNCTNCHSDPHNNQFGQNCRQCHTEISFLSVKGGTSGFDHNKTAFRLEGMHQALGCKECHKGKTTDPLAHNRCTDCHTDYHKGQFVKNGKQPDCAECHTVKGFSQFNYTVSQHNTGPFPLRGSHVATPCFECHRKQEKWSFRGIGIRCSDCHVDVHRDIIQSKYYADAGCSSCHSENRWSEVTFDHAKTGYTLTGAHSRQVCRACHFRPAPVGVIMQKFAGLQADCAACHTDNHYRQFEKNGRTNCSDCHGTENWKASEFDHNRTGFKLDGKHATVPCASCHKPQKEGSTVYIRYKIPDYKCESCH